MKRSWFYMSIYKIQFLINIFLGTVLLYNSLFGCRNESFEIENNFYYQRQKWIRDFYKAANKTKSDKITTHSYHSLYGLYLGPLRNQKLNVLEIGIGCNMEYGPGESIRIWREYLPNAYLSILEFDGECARKFRNQVDQVYVGDQSSFRVLRHIGKKGPYDVIIDDGGHSRKQQLNSLIGLWPYVKHNGGIYVMEDMQTSFMDEYNDNRVSSFDVTVNLIEYLLNSLKQVDYDDDLVYLFDSLLSINCFRESCVFVKK